MCGIAGYINKNSKVGNKERELIVKNMLRLMKHRGGDAMGIQTHNLVTIGHTRLAILDNRKSANQPFFNKYSILSINGEIYNHNELRNKYIKNETRSYSDSATLFELLQLISVKNIIKMICGMYAFSYLEKRKKLLTLVLDKFAIKPLYYVDTPDYFAWASEIKAFRAIPHFTFQFNSEHLEEYLVFRYIAGENTLFKNVCKMRAGEYLIYSLKNKTFKKIRYHDLKKFFQINSKFSENILGESVRAHLMSDKPVGIQLSGGLDSSLVAIFAKHFSKYRLDTFSIGLKDNKWNEFQYSDYIARFLKTFHHKIIFSKRNFARLFSKVTYYLDEPIAHPNTVPMYILAREARKHTEVLLTGEGADEIFYGYNRYLGLEYLVDRGILISNAFSTPDLVSRIIKKGSVFNERKKILRISHTIRSTNRKISYYDLNTYLPVCGGGCIHDAIVANNGPAGFSKRFCQRKFVEKMNRGLLLLNYT